MIFAPSDTLLNWRKSNNRKSQAAKKKTTSSSVRKKSHRGRKKSEVEGGGRGQVFSTHLEAATPSYSCHVA